MTRHYTRRFGWQPFKLGRSLPIRGRLWASRLVCSAVTLSGLAWVVVRPDPPGPGWSGVVLWLGLSLAAWLVHRGIVVPYLVYTTDYYLNEYRMRQLPAASELEWVENRQLS